MDEKFLQQVKALVQAAMQGDQKAQQQISQIQAAAQQGDQQAAQILQVIQQVMESMKQSAKQGAKLDYLKKLSNKCPQGSTPMYYRVGGKYTACACKKQGSEIKAEGTKLVQEFKRRRKNA